MSSDNYTTSAHVRQSTRVRIPTIHVRYSVRLSIFEREGDHAFIRKVDCYDAGGRLIISLDEELKALDLAQQAIESAKLAALEQKRIMDAAEVSTNGRKS